MSKKKVKEEPVAAEEDSAAKEGSPTAQAEAELAADAENSKPSVVTENIVSNEGEPSVSQPPAAVEPAEDAKEEASEKAAPPTEPDVPAKESEEVEEELDYPGVVTKLSGEKFLKLRRGWLGAGKPRRLNAFGRQWLAIDDGTKFVDQGAPGGMGDYGSLSTSSLRK